MKPWFVKEADIIKFPEPEKKVIELPNVQSYPDFLTGVKDLHSRKAKGEISQASHDKLYTDLIHRFMKKESFENPWFLREAPDDATGIMSIIQKRLNDPNIDSETLEKVLFAPADVSASILTMPFGYCLIKASISFVLPLALNIVSVTFSNILLASGSFSSTFWRRFVSPPPSSANKTFSSVSESMLGSFNLF